jgi:hypothetical protein
LMVSPRTPSSKAYALSQAATDSLFLKISTTIRFQRKVTPLRRALNAAGQYYCRNDNSGPWGNTPGTDDSSSASDHISCRHSYTILMTDGYWTEGTDYQAATSGARANNDGTITNNTTNSHPGQGENYSYTPADPFQDDRSNTLADVAMYYWKRNLRTDLDNKVPISPINRPSGSIWSPSALVWEYLELSIPIVPGRP